MVFPLSERWKEWKRYTAAWAKRCVLTGIAFGPLHSFLQLKNMKMIRSSPRRKLDSSGESNQKAFQSLSGPSASLSSPGIFTTTLPEPQCAGCIQPSQEYSPTTPRYSPRSPQYTPSLLLTAQRPHSHRQTTFQLPRILLPAHHSIYELATIQPEQTAL